MFVAAPGMAGLGWPELLIIVFVLMLLFGAKKLPDMARGTGRALRIFKAETKGLMEDDDDDETPAQVQRTTGATATDAATTPAPPALTRQPVTDAQIVTPVEPVPPTHHEQDR
jgi:sec-independent protein translocase protein TatA